MGMDPALELCLMIVAKNDRCRFEDKVCLVGSSFYLGILFLENTQIKSVQPLIERELTVIFYTL